MFVVDALILYSPLVQDPLRITVVVNVHKEFGQALKKMNAFV